MLKQKINNKKTVIMYLKKTFDLRVYLFIFILFLSQCPWEQTLFLTIFERLPYGDIELHLTATCPAVTHTITLISGMMQRNLKTQGRQPDAGTTNEPPAQESETLILIKTERYPCQRVPSDVVLSAYYVRISSIATQPRLTKIYNSTLCRR